MDMRWNTPDGMDDVLRRMLALQQGRAAALKAEIALRDQAIAQLEQQVAALDARLAARDRLIARQAHVIGGQVAHIEAQEQVIKARDGHIVGLERQAAILSRLADALEWPGGPRAVRAVLPVAKLLRRFRA